MEPRTVKVYKYVKSMHKRSDDLVNAKLLVALTNKSLYYAALRQFAEVYFTLEACISSSSQTMFDAKLLALVRRTESLQRDLRYYESIGLSAPVVSAPTRAYTAHIRSLVNQPALLIAHAYQQYMGFLAGGRLICAALRRSGVVGPQGQGLSAFDFGTNDEVQVQLSFRGDIMC